MRHIGLALFQGQKADHAGAFFFCDKGDIGRQGLAQTYNLIARRSTPWKGGEAFAKNDLDLRIIIAPPMADRPSRTRMRVQAHRVNVVISCGEEKAALGRFWQLVLRLLHTEQETG